MQVLETVFWASLLLGLYPYAGYPLVAAALASLRARVAPTGATPRSVSVVISAFNEAAVIEATVLNKLQQDFDGTLEVLVASDGSDDGTDEIVAAIARRDDRVKLFRQHPRQGKTAALNQLLRQARGEIVVFADANSMYRPDAVRRLVDAFADGSVGYVTGKMIYVSELGTPVGTGCTAYMRYENRLREIESRLGSVVGVDGGIDAVRRALYQPMRADQLPDFVLPLAVVRQGYRVAFVPSAVLEETTLEKGDAEFRMRVRVSLRALWALRDNADLLAGRAGALFAWQLWSHKALRYGSFVPLGVSVLAGVTLAALSPGHEYLLALILGYGVCAVAGALGLRLPGVTHAYYFALLNVASLVASMRFLRGEKQVLWTPRLG